MSRFVPPHGPQVRRACALTVAVAIGVSLGAAVATEQARAAPATKKVEYLGYRIEVPASWPVIDLDKSPGTCHDTTRNAVYLGHVGADARCPAHAAGRADSIHIEPLDEIARGHAPIAVDALAGVVDAALPGASTNEMQLAVTDSGVLVNITFRDSDRTVRDILTGAKNGGQGGTNNAEKAAEPQPIHPETTRYTGRGFDSCATPSVAALDAWRASPYRSVGFYLGGINRACGDGNLSAGWVKQVLSRGWHLQPIYVGPQSPCVNQEGLAVIDPAKPAQQGREAARDAAIRARFLGIGRDNILYYDMQKYDHTLPACSAATVSFLEGWTEQLHKDGYVSGVYADTQSGIGDLAKRYTDPRFARPDVIWTAHWDGIPDVFGAPTVPDHYWANRQRVHQYQGGHDETHGGVRLSIDSNILQTDPAPRTYPHTVVHTDQVNKRRGPGLGHDVTGRIANGGPATVVCQASGDKVSRTKVWDKLTDGSYVSDLYVDTTADSTGFAPPIPRC